MLGPDTSLGQIKGINKRLVAGLMKMRIATVHDLLTHFPFRYDDFSQAACIADLAVGTVATVHATVRKIAMRRTFRRNLTVIEAVLSDDTGSIRAVWFNQPYLMTSLAAGTEGGFAGKVTMTNGGICLSNPVYESAANEPTHTGGLVPIYPETKGVTSRAIRYLVKPILDTIGRIPDCLPPETLKAARLPDLASALRGIHFPETIEEAELGKKRMAFEDLFLLQTVNLRAKMRLAQEPAHPIPWTEAELGFALKELPFALTGPQQQSLDEILADLARPHPMNRLLQGDVGSGKTVVVAVAGLLAARHGFQTAIMAPTEVLARQHYKTFTKIFAKLLGDWQISVGLMTSGEARISYGEGLETDLPKARLAEHAKEGNLKIAIGTHALIQKTVSFPRLAFIAVDEQHRFGVEQRAALTKGARSRVPHFLSLSATPIPRTLSLAVFGDLELSAIDELPKGRLPIITKIVPAASRAKAYAFMRGQIAKGRQAFVICPRIEESEDGDADNPWSDVKAVTIEYEKLAKEIFPGLSVAMLHGKMKPAEKAETMHLFAEGKTHILVATSVIEVGVDVPNATVMAIEDADRFGLAQLYQFRGRVGRGEHQSVCLLFSSNKSVAARERLKALMTAKNGFELAEKDLALRGPGEFLGHSQTGMPDAMMGALKDMALVKAAREAALKIIASAKEGDHPLLEERIARFRRQVHLE